MQYVNPRVLSFKDWSKIADFSDKIKPKITKNGYSKTYFSENKISCFDIEGDLLLSGQT